MYSLFICLIFFKILHAGNLWLDEELCPDVGANVPVQPNVDLLVPGVRHHYQNASTQGRFIHRDEDPKVYKEN